MSDICGDAAVLFEGEDPGDIAARVFEVLSNPSLRDELSRRAVARATQFSWQQGAEKVCQIIEQLMPSRRAANREAETIPPERGT
jgi:glycosyltransferase involved in cell wall biosynthesis